jgi:hypothetical protein
MFYCNLCFYFRYHIVDKEQEGEGISSYEGSDETRYRCMLVQ